MQYKLQPPGKRGPCWYIRWTENGRDRERSTGAETRGGAETFAEEYFGELARRRVPGAGETVGFPRAARAYKAAKPHLSRQDIRKVDAVAGYFSDNEDCRLLTHAHLVAAANTLKPGRADSTKNRFVIGPAAAVLHYAAKNKWCSYEPIEKFAESRKSSRRPATEETMAALVRHLEDPPEALAPQYIKAGGVDPNLPYKKILLAVLYDTGLRLGHTLSIEWPRIFLADGRIGVTIPKSDELALVPISPATVALLANLPEADKTGRLFPWTTSRGVYPWLKRVKKRAGVHYTPHLSRHALATDAQDIPDKKAAELGVWLDPRSLHRYQSVKPEAIPGRHFGTVMAAAAAEKAPADVVDQDATTNAVRLEKKTA